MLPQITPSPGAVASVPPPSRFRPLAGTPSGVSMRTCVARGSVGLTEAQRNGLRYEAKAQDFLVNALGHEYYQQPYLHFVDGHSCRTLVPDGILIHEGYATIFEIKSQHMPEAWWQLRKLYEPVVRQLGGVRLTSCVEMVRGYDPAMGFPEEVVLCSKLSEVLEESALKFKVLQWRA